VYKRGIVIDYPADRSTRSGSCIFIHIWQGAGHGTVGCIAAEEARVARLQDWSKSETTAIVIWPKTAGERLAPCIPGLLLDDFLSSQSQT
nr:hypothetical protein [Alphaproteobacteria bacterium]